MANSRLDLPLQHSSEWVSLHLYGEPPFETFLREVVYPYLDGDIKKHCDGIFFVRFADPENHIRLRMKPKSSCKEDFLIADAMAYFKEQMAPTSTAIRGADAEVTKLSEPVFLRHIKRAEYSPEWDRYGRGDWMVNAEFQFQASSACVLEQIAYSKNWDKEVALGRALIMHVLFVRNLRMKHSQTVKFFSNYYLALAAALASKPREESAASGVTYAELNDKLNKHYSVQAQDISDAVKMLWSDESNHAFDEGWPLLWARDTRTFAARLFSLFDEDSANCPVSLRTVRPLKPDLYGTLEYMLRSMMHMTCNRLGIPTKDEAYLAYILWRSFSAIP